MSDFKERLDRAKIYGATEEDAEYFEEEGATFDEHNPDYVSLKERITAAREVRNSTNNNATEGSAVSSNDADQASTTGAAESSNGVSQGHKTGASADSTTTTLPQAKA